MGLVVGVGGVGAFTCILKLLGLKDQLGLGGWMDWTISPGSGLMFFF